MTGESPYEHRGWGAWGAWEGAGWVRKGSEIVTLNRSQKSVATTVRVMASRKPLFLVVHVRFLICYNRHVLLWGFLVVYKIILSGPPPHASQLGLLPMLSAAYLPPTGTPPSSLMQQVWPGNPHTSPRSGLSADSRRQPHLACRLRAS